MSAQGKKFLERKQPNIIFGIIDLIYVEKISMILRFIRKGGLLNVYKYSYTVK